MSPCELIQYGRRSHSIIAWETVALELERRLVTRNAHPGPMVARAWLDDAWDYHHRDMNRAITEADYPSVDDEPTAAEFYGEGE